MNAEEIVMKVAGVLEGSGIAYMLVGAFSSNFYGVPRSTQDADFLLQVEELRLGELGQGLGEEFEVDSQGRLETFTWGTYYTVRHRVSEFVMDLFLLRDDPHGQESFGRRVGVMFGGVRVYVPRVEDVIVTKLRWSQGGRRGKDVDDIRGILAVQTVGRIDLGYVRRWAGEHGTGELFEKLLAELD